MLLRQELLSRAPVSVHILLQDVAFPFQALSFSIRIQFSSTSFLMQSLSLEPQAFQLRNVQTILDQEEYLLASEEENKGSRQASVAVDKWSSVCLICCCF